MATKSKKTKQVEIQEVKASAKYLRVSPYKLRKVADHVRYANATDALKKLKIMNQKSAGIMYKLIHSAVSNAVHNFKLNEADLKIQKLIVNEGSKIKRSRSRAKGRVFAILKPTSHIEITLTNQGDKNGSKG